MNPHQNINELLNPREQTADSEVDSRRKIWEEGKTLYNKLQRSSDKEKS